MAASLCSPRTRETNQHDIGGTSNVAKFLIIGAGSRGCAYAAALKDYPGACVAAVAEPIAFKRESFGQKYIWNKTTPSEGQAFSSWQSFVDELQARRADQGRENSLVETIDGVFVCTLDETHMEIITALAPLGLHIMSEKPLATTWEDCLKIYRALQPPGRGCPDVVFSIGHVLRYSPHNLLLRKLALEDQVIGEILSVEHTEPVGWWHFSHSYVRGNWRKESTTAPSLLTKSCHDIDFLLWLLCSPYPGSQSQEPHLPSAVSSNGSLLYFKRSRKPESAGKATNCLSCPAEAGCIYSATGIYERAQLREGNAGWPVNIVDPEIEDLFHHPDHSRKDAASARLRQRLKEDYDLQNTSKEIIDGRPWFGRCVYEASNDVCDDQTVNMVWEEDEKRRVFAKSATFHMVASTEAQCERRGRIYGTRGEISYDSRSIRVFDFASKQAMVHSPEQPGGGHGGGDRGLAQGFAKAVTAVKEQLMSVEEAQEGFLGCTFEEVIRSHGIVFAAEEARKNKTVVDWGKWWEKNTG